jgi:Uma2 family endonuclease
MTSLLPVKPQTEIFYPSSDGEPLAETQVHVDAIIGAVVALRQYLGERAIVLADQFLYYSQGYPRLRVAPDAMVIFDVSPESRDNYKVWEEGQIPAVVFEMTSEGTRHQDEGFKKTLYEQLGVREYWQFDPKGEWIPEQLRGFRLRGETYELIADGRSEPLQLRLQVEGQLIGFYREDTGEKLLIPDEMAQALRSEIEARQQAEQRAEQERQRAEQERQRAEQAEQQLEQAEQQLEQERQRADRLAEYLRSQGIDPNQVL